MQGDPGVYGSPRIGTGLLLLPKDSASYSLATDYCWLKIMLVVSQ